MTPDKLSLPKDKIRVLLLEGINDSAVALMRAAGYTNLTRLPKALDREALHEALQGVHIVGIRSRTQLDAAAFEAADRLLAVGCFSVGTNQVDLEAARHRGIPVFNAPFSNTRSVAASDRCSSENELTMFQTGPSSRNVYHWNAMMSPMDALPVTVR